MSNCKMAYFNCIGLAPGVGNDDASPRLFSHLPMRNHMERRILIRRHLPVFRKTSGEYILGNHGATEPGGFRCTFYELAYGGGGSESAFP